MANMSYCRFHNTLQALADCTEALAEIVNELDDPSEAEMLEAVKKDLSEEEFHAFRRLVALAETVAENYGPLLEA
jgi:phytoene/squalene synthetase